MKVTLVYDIDDNDDNLKTIRNIIRNPLTADEIKYVEHKLADVGKSKAMLEGDFVELYDIEKAKLNSIRDMLI